MADLEDYRMSPEKFEAFLKKCASTSSIIYEANVEQFKKAEKEKKIKVFIDKAQISTHRKLVSTTTTYRWIVL